MLDAAIYGVFSTSLIRSNMYFIWFVFLFIPPVYMIYVPTYLLLVVSSKSDVWYVWENKIYEQTPWLYM